MSRSIAVSTAPRIVPIHAPGLTAVGQHPLVAASIGGAWLVLVIAQLSGNAAAFHHHRLIEGAVPPALAVLALVVAWQVMVVAMMWPASLHAIGSVAAATSRASLPGMAIAAFLGAIAAVWIGFGIAAFLGDIVVHHVVDSTPWLAARPWLIEAGVLGIAGAYQLTPLKRRSTAACRRPDRWAMSVEGTIPVALRLGLGHGLDCVASAWALMLVMFAAGFGSLATMAGLTVLMGYEVAGRHGQRAATAAGMVLILMALWVVSAPLPGAA